MRYASGDWHRIGHLAAVATERRHRSCLIFESKRMPRGRYTGFDVLPPANCSRAGTTMDICNRVPRCRLWQTVAYVRALLTTVFPLLTLRSAARRVRLATERWIFLDPYGQGVLDDERPMDGPGAPGAPVNPS